MGVAPATAMDEGRAALARGSWEQARRCFERAVGERPSGEAFEGLGWAGWWLADEGLTIAAREAAVREYRDQRDDCSAARVAAWLACDLVEFRHQPAIARGWLRRAWRLLEDRPPGPDHGWVAVLAVSMAGEDDGDHGSVARMAADAAALGRRLGIPDVEAVALAQQGRARVAAGDAGGGMELLDEACVLAGAERFELPLSPAWVLCCALSAADAAGDFERAAQWSAAMRAVSERWGGRQLLGTCRTSHGRVLATRGEWSAADEELCAAVADLEASRPALAAGGVVRLGELRARQGRTQEARELFERAGPRGILGLGGLALDAGDAGAAADAAERALRATPAERAIDRLPALELVVRAAAALGEPERAAAACAELRDLATRIGTSWVGGRARVACAELAACQGDHEEARRCFEDAVDRFGDASAPYDAALARLGLAVALAATGRDGRAQQEIAAARATFAALGATRDVQRADHLLDARPAGPSPAPRDPPAELTRRELDVLRLVALGLDDGEIAERLVLSPHTVHRHVANIRTKLRSPSRAAAVAHAARHGLL